MLSNGNGRQIGCFMSYQGSLSRKTCQCHKGLKITSRQVVLFILLLKNGKLLLIFLTFLENEIIWNVDNVLPEDVAVVVRMFVEVARLGRLGRLGRL